MNKDNLNNQFRNLLYPNENSSDVFYNFDIDVLIERMNEYFNDDVLIELNKTIKTVNVLFDDENVSIIFEQKDNVENIDISEINILNSTIKTLLNLIEVESIPFVHYADLFDNNPNVLELYKLKNGSEIKEVDFGKAFFDDIIEPIYPEKSEFLEIIEKKDFEELESYKIDYIKVKDIFLRELFKIKDNTLVMFRTPLISLSEKQLLILKEDKNNNIYEKVINMNNDFKNEIGKEKENKEAPKMEFNEL